MEYEFCLVLHQKLKDKIKGKIFTKVIDNTLRIRIDMDDLWFEHSYDNFVENIIFGNITSDKIVDEVCGKYRKFLLNRMERYYFKSEEETQN